MNDRELLEFAAKAGGIEKKWTTWRTGAIGKFGTITYTRHEGFNGWNPLSDDGDAFRLAVKLGFSIALYRLPLIGAGNDIVVILENLGDDPYLSTRRAIVRAAAEIGRTLP